MACSPAIPAGAATVNPGVGLCICELWGRNGGERERVHGV